MTVDHFRPESRYSHLRLVWTNLYYACWVCNSHYKRDHPTAAEEAAGERFVDPCRMDPDKHFRMRRDSSGLRFVVVPLTRPGRFTVRTLGFNERHFLRDWWAELGLEEVEGERQLDELRDLIQQAQAQGRDRPATQLQAILDKLAGMERACLARLDEVRAQWPFPVQR